MAGEKKPKKVAPRKAGPACPKCGEGTHLAEHNDRLHCGTCGYTRWKNK